ncbi:MAG TPA: bifunctional nuclease domain-containing protein [Candidatus Saccharimonadia bacterium]|nr:bifunctional nuclease domain-containing protein [Candidatus Saccharimonadia bacterium]
MNQCLVGCLVVFLSVCVSPLSSIGQALDEDVLEVKIKGVTIDPQGNTPVVILEEQQGHRAFPMWIGLSEARAIMFEMEGVPTPRPLTHVLLHNILVDLNVKIGRVIITDMQEDTFYATILLRQGNKTLTIDARPSDAIALALHVHAPVFATKKLLDAVRTVTWQEPPASASVGKALGMHIQNLDATLASFFHLAKAGGVLVSSVEAGSQAEQHGMRRGDVITSIDGKSIKDIQDFLATYKEKKVGQEMLCQVTRDRNPLMIRLLRSSSDKETKR